MNKRFIFFLILIIQLYTTIRLTAQGVAVNETGEDPNPSAVFDVSSTSKGVLISRMTTAERDAIENPALGLLVFNTTTNCINVRLLTSWKEICGECSFPLPVVSYAYPLCAGQDLNISTTTELVDASYAWTGPNGFVSSDQNPVIPNVTSSNAGVYVLRVTKDGCTSSPIALHVVLASAPASPADIIGPTGICNISAGGIEYSVDDVPGANYYSWTVPDAVITSGQGTKSIFVNFNGSSGEITVTATNTSNTCGYSDPVSIPILFSSTLPDNPGPITGASTFGVPQSGNVYSIDPISNVSEYIWSVPPGATISSGQGTPSITVDFTCSAISGLVSVYTRNGCGQSSTTSSYSVTASSPFSGPAFLSSSCLSTSTYSLSLPSTSGYDWTVPDGATILSGDGTNEILVDFSGDEIDGTICVSFTNESCGGASVNCLQIGVDKMTFDYTAGVGQFLVPSCITSITVDAYGAQGGAPAESVGGLGGRVQATLTVTPGDLLHLFIGEQPTGSLGGFNGGGAGGGVGFGGGGASDIRIGGTELANRVLVAGGGGGTSSPGRPGQTGGAGGGLTGDNGSNEYGPGIQLYGSGGTQSAGGSGETFYHYSLFQDGTLGQGGIGGVANGDGGGGGGGYYGGGGGDAGPGGGGSGFVTTDGSSGETQTNGQRTGNGRIVLTW